MTNTNYDYDRLLKEIVRMMAALIVFNREVQRARAQAERGQDKDTEILHITLSEIATEVKP